VIYGEKEEDSSEEPMSRKTDKEKRSLSWKSMAVTLDAGTTKASREVMAAQRANRWVREDVSGGI